MAYDFLGTFNQAMYDRLRTFVEAQVSLIKDRINHLSAEKLRIGAVTFKYDKGVPIGVVSDTTSYIGKLISAYEVLGGNPLVDLRVRLLSEPVFLLPGDELTGPTTMSNGEILGNKGLSDQDSAELIRRYRVAFDPTIRRRFDYLERKIRRAVDYADQLQAEVTNLNLLLQSIQIDGSLDNLKGAILQLLADPTYRAITPDTSPHAELGLDVYAPFSSYDVPEGAPQDPTVETPREATMTQRQSGNLPPVKPGQRSA